MGVKYQTLSKTYKCPKCNQKYDYEAHSNAIFGIGSENHSFKYYLDSPFRTCEKCGAKFIDDRFKEYVSLTEDERKRYFDNYNSRGPIVWIVIILIYSISGLIGAIGSKQQILLLIVILMCFPFLIIPIAVIKKRKKTIDQHIFDDAIKKSLERCMNKSYLMEVYLLMGTLNPLSDLEIKTNPQFAEINSLINQIISANK